MSRIGKMPVVIPSGVEVIVENRKVVFSGSKGSVEVKVPYGISVNSSEGTVLVKTTSKSKLANALSGTIRALLANAAAGVSQGWEKKLEITGTGYRGEVAGKDLTLTLGFSHPVRFCAPEGIGFQIEKNIITVSGVDRNLVGQVAANIRAARPPEPYKGKGISYQGEVIRRKAGKAAKAQGVA